MRYSKESVQTESWREKRNFIGRISQDPPASFGLFEDYPGEFSSKFKIPWTKVKFGVSQCGPGCKWCVCLQTTLMHPNMEQVIWTGSPQERLQDGSREFYVPSRRKTEKSKYTIETEQSQDLGNMAWCMEQENELTTPDFKNEKFDFKNEIVEDWGGEEIEEYKFSVPLVKNDLFDDLTTAVRPSDIMPETYIQEHARPAQNNVNNNNNLGKGEDSELGIQYEELINLEIDVNTEERNLFTELESQLPIEDIVNLRTPNGTVIDLFLQNENFDFLNLIDNEGSKGCDTQTSVTQSAVDNDSYSDSCSYLSHVSDTTNTTIDQTALRMTIADRIKVRSNRRETKPKRSYYEAMDAEEDDDDEDNGDEDYQEENNVYKKSRRTVKKSKSNNCEEPSDERYRELRTKNNEASRKSRLSRKDKERALYQEVDSLTQRNIILQHKAEVLEKSVNEFRAIIKKIVSANPR